MGNQSQQSAGDRQEHNPGQLASPSLATHHLLTQQQFSLWTGEGRACMELELGSQLGHYSLHCKEYVSLTPPQV